MITFTFDKFPGKFRHEHPKIKPRQNRSGNNDFHVRALWRGVELCNLIPRAFHMLPIIEQQQFLPQGARTRCKGKRHFISINFSLESKRKRRVLMHVCSGVTRSTTSRTTPFHFYGSGSSVWTRVIKSCGDVKVVKGECTGEKLYVLEIEFTKYFKLFFIANLALQTKKINKLKKFKQVIFKIWQPCLKLWTLIQFEDLATMCKVISTDVT